MSDAPLINIQWNFLRNSDDLIQENMCDVA